MAKIEDTIKDYANRSKEAVATFSAKAGERIQEAGDTLIQTIDTRRLKKRLETLYADLGKLIWEYHRDEKRISLKTKQFEIILDDITRTVEELEGRANLKQAETE